MGNYFLETSGKVIWNSWTLYCEFYYMIYSYVVLLATGTLDTLRKIPIEDKLLQIETMFKVYYAVDKSMYSSFCWAYFFHCCIVTSIYFSCNICVGNSWCCLYEIEEIQSYSLLMLFLEWNYREFSCNFLKLVQLLIDYHCKSLCGC